MTIADVCRLRPCYAERRVGTLCRNERERLVADEIDMHGIHVRSHKDLERAAVQKLCSDGGGPSAALFWLPILRKIWMPSPVAMLIIEWALLPVYVSNYGCFHSCGRRAAGATLSPTACPEFGRHAEMNPLDLGITDTFGSVGRRLLPRATPSQVTCNLQPSFVQRQSIQPTWTRRGVAPPTSTESEWCTVGLYDGVCIEILALALTSGAQTHQS